MKRRWLIIIALFSGCYSYSQKTEFEIKAGSGFFFFTGKTPVAHQNSTDLLIEQNPYTVPYGRKPGQSFFAGANAKHIFKNNLIAGGSFEFQSLSSRSVIDTLFVIGDPAASLTTTPLNGKSSLVVNYITVSPFAGKRIPINHISLDIMAGLDFGFLLNAKEKLDMKGLYPKKEERNIFPRKNEVRLRLETGINIKRVAFVVGYSRGLTNYYTHYTGGQPEAFSNFFHFGISYRLK